MIGFVIVAIFYCASYFSKHKSILKFLKLLPLFLSVSMAMSFHNSIAVIEGLFGFKSAFIRTPKFNINTTTQSLRSNIYIKHRLPKAFFAEIFLAIYFLAGVVLAFYYQDYGLLPFHLLLFTGFSCLNFYAVKHAM